VDAEPGIDFHPLFRFRMVALVANDHPLTQKDYVDAEDFRNETLITYPVEDDALDVVRLLLKPQGIAPARRTTELTVAILMLVSTRRGIAVLPRWAVQPYLQRQYVSAKPITSAGPTAQIWAAILPAQTGKAYIAEFIELVKETSAQTLPDIALCD
jgi:LysR family transcriptional regulator, regulator for metE and metH